MTKKFNKYNGLRYNDADPIRDNKYILEILDLLKNNLRNQALFMVGHRLICEAEIWSASQ